MLEIIAVYRNTILVTSYLLLYKVSILVNSISAYRQKFFFYKLAIYIYILFLQINAVYEEAILLQILTLYERNILLKLVLYRVHRSLLCYKLLVYTEAIFC